MKKFLTTFVVTVLIIIGLSVAIVRNRQGATGLQDSHCSTYVWPKSSFPIMVVLDPTAEEWKEELAAAVDFWNEASPKLFIDGGVLDADLTGESVVSVTAIDFPDIEPLHADTHLKWAKCIILGAKIEVPRNASPDRRRRILAHELGHLIPLGHSAFEDDVMYRAAIPGGYRIRPETRSYLNRLF